MTGPEVKRKLTAILSADVKGYSRLMGEDEVGTIRTLTAYKEVLTGFVQSHQGRVVGTAGDSVLAEFASVVDALQCAAEVQKELKSRNVDVPESRRMEFRIGVNLGDVVGEGETILRMGGILPPGAVRLFSPFLAYDLIKSIHLAFRRYIAPFHISLF